MKNALFIVALMFSVAHKAYGDTAAASGEGAKEVCQAGTLKSFKGPEKLFTGDVQMDMVFPANNTAHCFLAGRQQAYSARVK